MEGYRFPLRGLRPDEAEALLILGVPGAVRELGLDGALDAALPADEQGWRVVTLSFEHERAAAHRLAGFGDQVEVLTPHAVRAGLVATARQILGRYHADDG
jgi:predicted DNA-binding transcriptional regulator YafY